MTHLLHFLPINRSNETPSFVNLEHSLQKLSKTLNYDPWVLLSITLSIPTAQQLGVQDSLYYVIIND